MAHGVADGLTGTEEENCVKMVTKHHTSVRKTVGVMGSRRIFAPAFKLKVLDSYRNDIDCRGNQRATARKYGIHRRQIQKWLQCEESLRSSCVDAATPGRGHGHSSVSGSPANSAGSGTLSTSQGAPRVEGSREPAAAPAPALNLSRARLHGDEELSLQPAQQGPPLRQHCPASPRYASPRPVITQNGNSLGLSPIQQTGTVSANETLQQQPQQQHFLTTTHHHPDGYLGAAGCPEAPTSYYLPNGGYEIEPILYEEGSHEVKLYHQQSSARYERSPVQRYPHSLRQENFPGISVAQRDIGSQISAAAAIKSEPAGLDAVATVAAAVAAGPCDLREQPTRRPSSRSADRSPLPPPRSLSPHLATTAAVHSELSRTSPLVRTQPTTHDDGGSGGAKADENSGNANKDGNSAASLRQAVARPYAYPEPHHPHVRSQIHQQQHHQQQQQQHHLSQTQAHSLGDGEYADRSQPPASGCSAPAQYPSSVGSSPPSERVSYSGPLSPAQSLLSPQSSRGPLSSGHSTTSSDSETDALDYSTATALAPSNSDLARRRSFSLRFKLDVLDAFHRDAGVAGNQRATARKFGINRRQVQKWLSQETELRGEIALRGGVSRQRLGPLSSADSPIDLRTHNAPPESLEVQLVSPQERASADSYCCYSPDTASPNHRQSYFVATETSEVLLSSSAVQRRCTLSCCADNLSCYSQESLRISESTVCSYSRIQTCYASDSPSVFTCFSSHDSAEISIPEKRDCTASCYSVEQLGRATSPNRASSPLKRSCTLSCCSYASSPKRFRSHNAEDENPAPQDAPLCLVKPKGGSELASQVEPVTSTVPTPPAPPAVPSVPPSVASTKRDAILFKPYLDNPIAKPVEDQVLLSNGSPLHNTNNNNNNNNCNTVCNLNSNVNAAGNRAGEGYALELSLRVPISWGTPDRGIYSDIPQVGSAFARYPTAPHYT